MILRTNFMLSIIGAFQSESHQSEPKILRLVKSVGWMSSVFLIDIAIWQAQVPPIESQMGKEFVYGQSLLLFLYQSVFNVSDHDDTKFPLPGYWTQIIPSLVVITSLPHYPVTSPVPDGLTWCLVPTHLGANHPDYPLYLYKWACQERRKLWEESWDRDKALFNNLSGAVSHLSLIFK